MKELNPGDYVLATKWYDGDPQDPWCIGFYKEKNHHSYKSDRHIVVDNDGKSFLHNGFRRVKKISAERGKFIIDNMGYVENSRKSLWGWAIMSMKKFNEFKNNE